MEKTEIFPPKSPRPVQKRFSVGDRVIVLENLFDETEDAIQEFGKVEGMYGKIICIGSCTASVKITGRATGKNTNDAFWLSRGSWPFLFREIEHCD